MKRHQSRKYIYNAPFLFFVSRNISPTRSSSLKTSHTFIQRRRHQHQPPNIYSNHVLRKSIQMKNVSTRVMHRALHPVIAQRSVLIWCTCFHNDAMCYTEIRAEPLGDANYHRNRFCAPWLIEGATHDAFGSFTRHSSRTQITFCIIIRHLKAYWSELGFTCYKKMSAQSRFLCS